MEPALKALSKFSAAAGDIATPLIKEEFTTRVNEILERAITLSFPLDEEDLLWANSLIPGVNFKPTYAVNSVDQTIQHPRMKVYEKLAHLFNHKSSSIGIEIGPDVTKESIADHGCSIPDAHNQYRRNNKQTGVNFCNDKYCSHKSDFIFANMVFDISVGEWLDIMERHHASTSQVSILLDNLDALSCIDSQCELILDSNSVCYKYGEEFAYVHDRSKIESWLHVAEICARRGYIAEYTRTLSLLKIINIAKGSGCKTYYIPRELSYKGYVRLPIPADPSMFMLKFSEYSYLTDQGFAEKMYQDCNKLYVPRETIAKIIEFVEGRSDTTFSRSNFAQYVRSLSFKIIMNTDTEHVVPIDKNYFDAFVTIFFEYASALRRNQTKCIGDCTRNFGSVIRSRWTQNVIYYARKLDLLNSAYGGRNADRLKLFMDYSLSTKAKGDFLYVEGEEIEPPMQFCPHGRDVIERVQNDYNVDLPYLSVMYSINNKPILNKNVKANDGSTNSNFNYSKQCVECGKLPTIGEDMSIGVQRSHGVRGTSVIPSPALQLVRLEGERELKWFSFNHLMLVSAAQIYIINRLPCPQRYLEIPYPGFEIIRKFKEFSFCTIKFPSILCKVNHFKLKFPESLTAIRLNFGPISLKNPFLLQNDNRVKYSIIALSLALGIKYLLNTLYSTDVKLEHSDDERKEEEEKLVSPQLKHMRKEEEEMKESKNAINQPTETTKPKMKLDFTPTSPFYTGPFKTITLPTTLKESEDETSQEDQTGADEQPQGNNPPEKEQEESEDSMSDLADLLENLTINDKSVGLEKEEDDVSMKSVEVEKVNEKPDWSKLPDDLNDLAYLIPKIVNIDVKKHKIVPTKGDGLCLYNAIKLQTGLPVSLTCRDPENWGTDLDIVYIAVKFNLNLIIYHEEFDTCYSYNHEAEEKVFIHYAKEHFSSFPEKSIDDTSDEEEEAVMISGGGGLKNAHTLTIKDQRQNLIDIGLDFYKENCRDPAYKEKIGPKIKHSADECQHSLNNLKYICHIGNYIFNTNGNKSIVAIVNQELYDEVQKAAFSENNLSFIVADTIVSVERNFYQLSTKGNVIPVTPYSLSTTYTIGISPVNTLDHLGLDDVLPNYFNFRYGKILAIHRRAKHDLEVEYKDLFIQMHPYTLYCHSCIFGAKSVPSILVKHTDTVRHINDAKKEHMDAPLASDITTGCVKTNCVLDVVKIDCNVVEIEEANDEYLEFQYKTCQMFGIKIANYNNKFFVNYSLTTEKNVDSMGSCIFSFPKEKVNFCRDEFVRNCLQIAAPYKECHQLARDNLPPVKKTTIIAHGFIGRAGSGKSTFMRKIFPAHSDTCFITPSNKLKQEYSKKGYTAYTIAKFIGEAGDFENIIIDEYFTFHLYAILIAAQKCKNLYLIGDDLQTHYGSSDITTRFKIEDYIETADFPRRHISYSVPLDITYICRTKLEYGIFTGSSIKSSLVSHDNSSHIKADDTNICFTREYRKSMLKWKFNTAPQIQGSRPEVANLVIEPGATSIFNNLKSHFIVNLTRHTKVLNYRRMVPLGYDYLDLEGFRRRFMTGGGLKQVYCEDGIKEFNSARFVTNQPLDKPTLKQTKVMEKNGISSVRFDNAKSHSGVLKDYTKGTVYEKDLHKVYGDMDYMDREGKESLIDCHASKDVEFHLPEEVLMNSEYFMPIYDVNNFSLCLADFENQIFEHNIKDNLTLTEGALCLTNVDSIMEKISPSELDHFSTSEYVFYNSFCYTDGKMKLKNEEDFFQLTEMNICRFPVPIRGRPYIPGSFNQSLHTAAVRSRGQGFEFSELEKTTMVTELFMTFKRFVRPCQVTSDDLMNAYASYLSRSQAKTDKFKQIEIFDEDLHEMSTKTQYFHKVQTKKDLKPNSYARFNGIETKAGQSVCPTAKGLNHATSMFIRAAESKILNNIHDKIYLHFGRSRSSFSDFLSGRYIPGYKFVSSDYTEFDTFHDEVSNQLMEKILEYIGINKIVLKELNFLNENWTMDGGAFRIEVINHLKSGRPDTLFKNTMYNMCLALRYFSVEGFQYACFCGDDSTIHCKSLYANEFPKLMRHKVKAEEGYVGNFVGFLITDRLYVDIPRIVCGVLNKTFSTNKQLETSLEERVHEYQLGVWDYFALFDNMQHLYNNISVVAEVYKLAEAEVEMLVDFLTSYSLCEPEEIIEKFESVSTEPRIITNLNKDDIRDYIQDINAQIPFAGNSTIRPKESKIDKIVLNSLPQIVEQLPVFEKPISRIIRRSLMNSIPQQTWYHNIIVAPFLEEALKRTSKYSPALLSTYELSLKLSQIDDIPTMLLLSPLLIYVTKLHLEWAKLPYLEAVWEHAKWNCLAVALSVLANNVFK
jgi:hypothetical protein